MGPTAPWAPLGGRDGEADFLESDSAAVFGLAAGFAGEDWAFADTTAPSDRQSTVTREAALGKAGIRMGEIG